MIKNENSKINCNRINSSNSYCGIGIYIYADIQTQHGMTVEKYCEKYDCHIVEYKYYDADTIYAILEDNNGNSCGSIKMHSNYVLNIVELDTSNFHPPGGL